jgi:hypothetical protein
MTIDETISNYYISDGQVISLKIDFNSDNNSLTSVTIVLKIWKNIGAKKTTETLLQLIFTDLTQLDIVENFDSTYYSDIKLTTLETDEYYLSLDPYDNSLIPNEKDNFKIKAKTIKITELE